MQKKDNEYGSDRKLYPSYGGPSGYMMIRSAEQARFLDVYIKIGITAFLRQCVCENIMQKMIAAPVANYRHHTEARAVIENKNAAHGAIRTVWYVRENFTCYVSSTCRNGNTQ
jgi:hypothetical protein